MKYFLFVSAVLLAAIISFGCADTSVPVSKTSSSRSSSSNSNNGGIDPITQAGIDETSRQTQEDAQSMSDWLNQQNILDMQNQANQMANQAAMDASNAAAAAASAAAANQ